MPDARTHPSSPSCRRSPTKEVQMYPQVKQLDTQLREALESVFAWLRDCLR